jgi:hypothetical protein
VQLAAGLGDVATGTQHDLPVTGAKADLALGDDRVLVLAGVHVRGDDPDHPVRQAIAEHRRWFRGLLRDLLVADGHPDPDRTADILVALKDGLLVGADLDNPARRSLIRDAVARLLDGAVSAGAWRGQRRARSR